ncbi:hypothetical protein KAR91_56175 [Candidatus Pacearchaeota archaeon]|nr:hypothetical protein [Candidatus Pacearchaeota archaeon]
MNLKIGNRELKDMTPEEIEELVVIAGIPLETFLSIPAKINSLHPELYASYWEELKKIRMLSVSAEDLDCLGGLEIIIWMGKVEHQGKYCNPVEVFKWFIDKGFNVFGMSQHLEPEIDKTLIPYIGDGVSGEDPLNEIQLLCVQKDKYKSVDLCIKTNSFHLPFAEIKLFNTDRYKDAESTYKAACALGNEICRAFNERFK